MSRRTTLRPPAFEGSADPLDAIAEDFAHRMRRGERPDIEAYAQRHPARANELRDVLAAVAMLEDAACAAGARHRTSSVSRSPEGPPRRLGDFELLRELGRGGMGVVYEAIQRPLGRSVALKLLAPGIAASPGHRARFVREARAASRLHHTHIVPVFGVGHVDGYDYYAMQYIDGASLAGASLDGWRTAAAIAEQVARALDHAHAHGVLHRDVKPANILRDGAGQPWLADFGLARLEDASAITAPGAVLGTLAYMAPECLSGRPADARSDIYALGVTLYELTCGERPFPGEHAVAVMEAIRAHRPRRARELVPSLPRDLDTVIHTAMAKEPAARYPSARALAEDLARVLEDRPIAARRASVGERAWRLVRAHRAVSALALALGLSLIGAAGSGWYLYHGERAALARADAHAASEAAQAAVARRNLALSLETLGALFESIASDQARAGLRPEHPDPRRDPGDPGPRRGPPGRESDGDGSDPTRPEATAHEIELIERILAFYERFAAENDSTGSLGLRRDLVLAHCRVGALLRRLERPADARAALTRAVALADVLVGAHPEDQSCALQLARALASLATLAPDAEALVLLSRAQAIALPVALAMPNDAALISERATWHIDLARVHERAGRRDQGVLERRQAIALWDSLSRDTPELPRSLFAAATLRAIAHQELESREPSLAVVDLEAARAAVARVYTVLEADSPHARHAQELDGELAGMLVRAYSLVGRHDDANRLRRAIPPQRR